MSAVRHFNDIHKLVRFTPCNYFCSVEIQNLVACLIIHAQNCVSVFVTVVFLLPSSTQVTSMQPLWQLQSIIVLGIMAKSTHGLNMHPVHLLELLVLLEPQMTQEMEKLQCVSVKDFSKVDLIQVT